MSNKILTGTAATAIGAFTNLKVTIPQADIDAGIDADSFAPYAIVWSGPADLRITQARLMSVKDAVNGVRILPTVGRGLLLSELNSVTKVSEGGIPVHSFKSTHGLELVLDGNGGAAAGTLDVVLKVQNSHEIISNVPDRLIGNPAGPRPHLREFIGEQIPLEAGPGHRGFV